MFEEKKIFKSQTSSLFIANEYLKKCRNKGINVDISPLCDFVMWADCIGHQKLLLLKNPMLMYFQERDNERIF